MLESIIFHFVAVVFMVWVFVWALQLNKKLHATKNVILSLLLLKNLEFPRHKSIVKRASLYLEEELSRLFKCKVFISTQELNHENYLISLCFFLVSQCGEKCFLYEGKFYDSFELLSAIHSEKDLLFCYNFDKKFWNVEFKNAT